MHPWFVPLAATAVISAEVPLYVEAPLPPFVLEEALEEADRLFAPGGVRFEWRLSPSEPTASARVVVVILERPESPVITGCSRNLHDHRLGLTQLGARRVTLWTEQVARAVHGNWDLEPVPTRQVDERALGTALGRVLAHELGHLFLRLNGHRDGGLMKPSFSKRALVGKSDRSFLLGKTDLELLREAVEESLRPAPGSSPNASR